MNYIRHNDFIFMLKKQCFSPVFWVSNLCVCIFVIMQFTDVLPLLMYDRNRIVNDIELWRIITPIFMHFSFVHLAFNVVIFVRLAKTIEVNEGKWRIFILTFIIAIISNFLQYHLNGNNGNFGGISGVVNGIIGYMAILSYLKFPFSLYIVARSLFVFCILIIAAGYLFIPQLANECHLFGLLTGVICGFVSYKLSQNRVIE